MCMLTKGGTAPELQHSYLVARCKPLWMSATGLSCLLLPVHPRGDPPLSLSKPRAYSLVLLTCRAGCVGRADSHGDVRQSHPRAALSLLRLQERKCAGTLLLHPLVSAERTPRPSRPSRPSHAHTPYQPPFSSQLCRYKHDKKEKKNSK